MSITRKELGFIRSMNAKCQKEWDIAYPGIFVRPKKSYKNEFNAEGVNLDKEKSA